LFNINYLSLIKIGGNEAKTRPDERSSGNCDTSDQHAESSNAAAVCKAKFLRRNMAHKRHFDVAALRAIDYADRPMFQTFSDTSAKDLTPERIARLRAELKRLGVDGFIVPRADEFQGEYVPPHAERLGWLTGFSGSAGEAVILAGKAAIFVDGRYTLQVREQVDQPLSRRSRYRRTSRGPGRRKPATRWQTGL
jgi:hypothetical protein